MSGSGPNYEGTGKQRLYGVYPALVTDVADPDDQGRVEVKLPWVDEQDGETQTHWARLATMMAGDERGTWFIPEPGDEVLVNFIAGDPSRPVVVGGLWNGEDDPPEQMDGAGENNVRSVTSRSGHRMEFDDTSGAEKVSVETSRGHELLMDDGEGTITVEHTNGSKLEIDMAGTITIRATSRVEVDAPAGMEISASQLDVKAGMSMFSGVVKANSVITNSVVSSTYTPGAGNVL